MKLFSQYKGLRKELYYIFIGRVITAMGSFIMPLMTLILRRKLGFSPSQITLTITIISLVLIPASLLGGKLTDWLGRKKLIVMFDSITILLYLVAGFMPMSIWTIVVIAGAAFFAQLEQPAYDALVADFSLTKDRERAYSMGYLGWNLGYIVGPSLGGLLFENHLTLCFIITAIATLCSTIIIGLKINEQNSYRNHEDEIVEVDKNEYETEEPKSSLIKVLLNRKVIISYLLIIAISNAVYMSYSIIIPLALESEYLEMGATHFGFLSSLNGLVVIIFTPIMTLLLKKLKILGKISLGIILISLGLFSMIQYKTLLPVYFGMFVFTIGEVTETIGRMAYLTRRTPSSHRGRVTSTETVVTTIASMVSQLFIGYALEVTTYSNVTYLYVIIGIVTALLLLLIIKFDKKRFPKLYNK